MKKYVKIELSVVVDTDLENVNDIIDSVNIDITPNNEQVQVLGEEVQNFYLENQ